MRSFVVSALIAAVALSGAAVSPAAGQTGSDIEVKVFFTRGEQLATVERTVAETPPVEPALRALFAGPSAAERARGFRTNIPRAAVLNSVAIRDGVAWVDVGPAFARGRNAAVQARLAQVVFTATQAGAVRVRVTVDGRLVARLGGIVIPDPIGRGTFAPTPYGGMPSPPPPGPFSPLVQAVQRELIERKYLPEGAADGRYGPQTRHGILAFQGWERLARDGRVTRSLLTRLRAASAPTPRAGSGRRVEVSIARQVALFVQGTTLVRVVHVSTGAPGYDTPRGSFRVFRKELRSWSYPYRVWLPYASYFVGGVAFHESPDVPAHAASHGCVRIPSVDAPFVYRFAALGTRVVVS